MDDKVKITKEQYIIRELSRRIADLEVANAELKFMILVLQSEKQEVENGEEN